MRNLLGVILVMAAACCVGGCGDGRPRSDDGRVAVAVSILPQKWVVEKVGDDHVRVSALLSPGDDPHTFQPADTQITEVMRARVWFRIGVPFERGKWSSAIASSTRLQVADMHRGIALREMEQHEHDAAHGDEARDPHVWLSPRLLKVQARNVADTLTKLDPANAADYTANLAALEGELDALEAKIRDVLAPARGRAFLIFHPAWGYFADEFGLRQMPVEIEGKDPTDAELTALTESARRMGATVLFVQPQMQGKSPETVARAIGGRIVRLDPLGENVPDNLLAAGRAIAAALAADAKDEGQ